MILSRWSFIDRIKHNLMIGGIGPDRQAGFAVHGLAQFYNDLGKLVTYRDCVFFATNDKSWLENSTGEVIFSSETHVGRVLVMGAVTDKFRPVPRLERDMSNYDDITKDDVGVINRANRFSLVFEHGETTMIEVGSFNADNSRLVSNTTRYMQLVQIGNHFWHWQKTLCA